MCLGKPNILVGGGRCGARIRVRRCIIWWKQLIKLDEGGAGIGANKQRVVMMGATLIANK